MPRALRPQPARNTARQGVVEARRSRVPHSGIASATPKAPLTWEKRPRRLRGTPQTPTEPQEPKHPYTT
jgi:hypothetical protein